MAYQHDVEQSGTSERTPMLGGSSQPNPSSIAENMRRSVLRVFQFFGGGIYAPDPSTYDPIEILLNTVNETEKDDLTRLWRDNKLSEMSFVGVVVGTPRLLHQRLTYFP
jgi:hypothetical protein